MKKTTNSNPLKYFNDEKAKRVAKLTKYQSVGEVNENAKNIINRYNTMNKDTANNKGKEQPWTGASTLLDQGYGNPQALIEDRSRELRRKVTEAIINSAKNPRPKVIDPNTGGMKKEKKGGQTKSKKK
jgi:hypothetical protein